MFQRVVVYAITTWSAFALFLSFLVYVWATAPKFGPVDLWDCNNHIVYVFWFKSIRVTVPWLRWLWVAGASVRA